MMWAPVSLFLGGENGTATGSTRRDEDGTGNAAYVCE